MRRAPPLGGPSRIRIGPLGFRRRRAGAYRAVPQSPAAAVGQCCERRRRSHRGTSRHRDWGRRYWGTSFLFKVRFLFLGPTRTQQHSVTLPFQSSPPFQSHRIASSTRYRPRVRLIRMVDAFTAFTASKKRQVQLPVDIRQLFKELARMTVRAELERKKSEVIL
uniref:Histone domain-containing protein n=1 Tax=Steinernema glaseri TaxID=37863 RepID=A0A1I8A3X7_9BILA